MRFALAALLVAIILLPLPGAAGAMPPSRQAGKPMPLERYWQEVDQTRQKIDNMFGLPSVTVRSQLDDLAARWEAITEVELPDGALLPVEHSELVALFRTDPPDLVTLRNRLGALLSARDRFPDGVFSQKDVDSLAKILADSRFQWNKPSQAPAWWTNFWKNILEWLDRLLGNSGSVSIPGFRTVLTIVLGILLAGILIYAGRGLWGSLVGEAELGDTGAAGQEPLTSESALQRADALSGEGNYRSAVRYLYLSALLLLDERGLLRYDRSRTNREYLRTLRDAPALSRSLQAVIDIFDRVWYGFEQIDGDTYQQYLEQVGELRKQKP